LTLHTSVKLNTVSPAADLQQHDLKLERIPAMTCFYCRLMRSVLVALVLLSIPTFAAYSLLADGSAMAEQLALAPARIAVAGITHQLPMHLADALTPTRGDEVEEIVSTEWTFTSKGGSSGWSGQGQPTATTLTGPSTSTYGTNVTFTATVTVTGSNPKGTPTGTVNFYDGTTLLGSSSATGSGTTTTATFYISILSTGTHYIQAEYLGTQNVFIYSYSNVVAITVH
jgi:hypothetical protein